ncbi:MAG: hypothetical protein MRJ65_08720 [Candidatus Brocadiaceae bacterium]|nr:hypothetical protein [Candidatus Brocadiaceae bacterium]
MVIIDNINQLLGDSLKNTIRPESKLKIAASCFSMYAYEALKRELQQIDSLQFFLHPPRLYLTRFQISSGKKNGNSISQRYNERVVSMAQNLRSG